MSRLLNVGGGSKSIALPPAFLSHEHVLLDVVDGPDVDVVGDATDLLSLVGPASFDVVYMSHVLEHLYEHDARTALSQAHGVLVSGGMLLVRVPDLAVLCAKVVAGAGLLDVVQHCETGPIRAADVLFGNQAEVACGRVFMAHRFGFDAESLWTIITAAGFATVEVAQNRESLELWAAGYSA